MKNASKPTLFDPKTASKSQLADMVLALMAQLEAKDTELQASQVEIQTKQVDIQAKELKIQALTFELAHLRRMRYGVKSESLTQQQRDLFTDTWNEDLAAIEAELEELTTGQPVVTAERPKRSRAGRQPLPEHLPRIEHRHEPESCTCGHCGNNLVMIREDITEQLDVEPAKFFVHRHIRPQYACRHCETVTAAPIPAAIIDGGMAAVGLLVWLLVCKYVDHLPLYRIEQIAARHQVNLARTTLSDWVGRLGVALQPLADRLAWHLLQGNTLHADETPVSQLDPGRGKTQKAYLWAYRSNDLQPVPRIIVFDYQSGRSGACVRQFLGDWQGHLMVDDYVGYKASFNNKKTEAPCIELACWVHVRRKFFDLVKADQNPMAKEAVERINGLYDIERQCNGLDAAARQQLRTEQAQPILDALHLWLNETRARTAMGSNSAKAIDYTLRRWNSLIRYAKTSHLPIDNNPVENVIRPIAIGKKIGYSWDPNAQDSVPPSFKAYLAPLSSMV
jgi:transposase